MPVLRRTTPLALIFLGLGYASVQAQTYSFTGTTFAYDTPSSSASTVTWHSGTAGAVNGPPACTNYPQGDDDYADIVFPAVSPAFTFTFAGVSYSGVRIYSNGLLKFGTDTTGWWRQFTPQTTLPTTTTYAAYGNGCTAIDKGGQISNTMMGYWVDLVSGSAASPAGAVKYELLGTAPNRRLVISWVNVKLYSNSNRFNFQVALYESPAGGLNSNFKYQYTSGSSNGSGALVGVQVGPTDGTLYAYNQLFIDPDAGSAILWYPSNQAIATSASYRFDEAQWSGTPNEVKDSSGNDRHGVRVGVANTTSASGGKICQGGQLTSNTSNTVIDAVSLPLTPSSSGAINFWYQSTKAWNTAAALLFDATTTAAQPFYLMKAANGGLQFGVTDTGGTVFVLKSAANYTFAASTWHHVGVTWNLQPGTNQTLLQMFVDGALVSSTRTTSTGAIANGVGNLYVGDNRTSGVTPSGGTPNGANGVIDEVNVYNVQASATQVSRDYAVTRPGCSAVLDHFHIAHNGLVSDCSTPAQITISAHDVTHSAYPLTGVTLNLSTSPARGTWSQVTGGSISLLSNVVAGAGTASYTFSTNASNPNGETSVTFGLNHVSSESLTLRATLGSVTETSGAAASCVVNDYTTPPTAGCNVPRQYLCVPPYGFNCVETSLTDAINGRLYTKVVGQAFSFDVVALKDAATVQTSYASGTDKSVTVELVNGSGSTACASRTAISPAVSQTLTFLKTNQPTNQGRLTSGAMTASNAYPDVRCRITDANQSPSVLGCSADSFAIRPQGIAFNTSASATAPGATATPTVAAGRSFTLQAVASPATATNYTGTLTQVASNITAQDPTQTTQVGGGTPGGLTPTTLLTGSSAANAAYLEVGYVYLNPGAYADTTYTAIDSAAGDCVAGSSSNTLNSGKYGCSVANQSTQSLGRFIPDHFETAVLAGPPPLVCPTGLTCVSNPSPSASGLVYSKQPFTVQVTAKTASAAGNAVTKNYTGNFAKTSTLTAWGAKGGSTNQNPGGGALSSASLAASAFAAGVGATPLVSQPNYALGTSTTAPTDVFLRATEGAGGDGVTSLQSPATNSVEVAVKVASGRIFISNVYGSEKLPLPLPITVQYYTGTYWTTSLTDSSSVSFNSALFTAGGHVTATQVAGPAGCVSVNSPTTASVASGVRTLSLAANSAICSYNMSINNAPSYLPMAPSAGGRATFGIFKSPLIYRRENY